MILLLKLRNDWLIGDVKELEVELGDPDLEISNPLILGPEFKSYIPDKEVSQCRLRFMDCDTMMEPGPQLQQTYLRYVEQVLQQDRTSG